MNTSQFLAAMCGSIITTAACFVYVRCKAKVQHNWHVARLSEVSRIAYAKGFADGAKPCK